MEYSLVGYTVFMQLAVGLVCAGLSAARNGDEATERRFLAAAFAAGLAASLSSFLHLSDVFHAPYTVTQVGHVWMSREILLTGLFMGLSALRLLGILKSRFWWLPALCGVLLILAMIRIYSGNTAMPLWNNAGTGLSFVAAAGLMGGFGGAALYRYAETGTGHPDGRARLCLGIGLLCMPFAFVQPVFWPVVIAGEALDGAALACLVELAVPLSLLSAGATAAAGCLATVCPRGKIAGWTALFLVTAGVAAGRCLFYAASIKTGIQFP